MTEGSHPPLDGEPQAEPRDQPLIVGYLDGMPRRTRAAMRGVVLGVFAAVAVAASALTSAQLPFDASGYDLIAVRTFEGVVRVVVGSIPLGDDVVDVREGHRRRRRVEGRGVAGDRRGRQ